MINTPDAAQSSPMLKSEEPRCLSCLPQRHDHPGKPACWAARVAGKTPRTGRTRPSNPAHRAAQCGVVHRPERSAGPRGWQRQSRGQNARKAMPKSGRGFWGGRAVSPLRNLGSYAWGAAGADKLIGHPDQLDVVVLGDPAHHVEGLVGVDFVAFHQDALSLPDDGSV
jgi:hypothetical protein